MLRDIAPLPRETWLCDQLVTQKNNKFVSRPLLSTDHSRTEHLNCKPNLFIQSSGTREKKSPSSSSPRLAESSSSPCDAYRQTHYMQLFLINLAKMPYSYIPHAYYSLSRLMQPVGSYDFPFSDKYVIPARVSPTYSIVRWPSSSRFNARRASGAKKSRATCAVCMHWTSFHYKVDFARSLGPTLASFSLSLMGTLMGVSEWNNYWLLSLATTRRHFPF